ncbi:GntR family transcriptional regulator [Klebsiella grimontii]|uniref:GntR family transcriptional regulator n=1 Tax=Klebsiella grimontii TaxID=2058152 RepID=UPI000D7EA8F8|nr:GntR family transcriptional regulator [Klebsiella grimontii]AWT20185.1 transcriptional regulator [Klebsiella michiganensis]MBE8894632.1 GntR family transcriptional regulator [Klebsiella grimontii]QLT89084.1 GntR family transcriptional regulator [Klebsiella grimontii]QQQ23299.1 GntR family transcriptional regulator [Klebsiella grimontii]
MQPDSTASSRRIARQILDLISEAKFDPGHHLREQHLADALGVSRTPVRAGLKELTRMGAVEARPNQGFFLLKRSNELELLEIEQSKSNDQKLYEQLVHDRIAGVLPESFTQTEISQRYEVDRGVLTRTLVKLSEDGLIARNAGHGWRFLQTLNSDVALRNSYGFRLMIEPTALLTPNLHVDRQMLKRLRAQHLRLITHPDITQVPAKEIFETDALFHELLAEASGNLFVVQAIQQQNRLRRLLEFGSYHNKRRVKEWCEEHVAIIDALGENKQEQAAELMRKHLQYAFDQVNVKNGRA